MSMVKLAELLRDPESGSDEFQAETFGVSAGALNWYLRDGVLMTFEEDPEPPGLAQKIMESKVYAWGYEELFRPRLTRIVTRQTLPEAIALSLRWLELNPADKVLDIACGTGNYTRALADALDPAEGLIVGFDLSVSMLKRGAEKRDRAGLSHMHLMRGDARRLPFKDASFDAINLTGAFHLIPEPTRVMAEMRRVLKPGGKLVLGTFLQSTSLGGELFQRWFRKQTAFRFEKRSELEQLLSDACFELQRFDVVDWAATLYAVAR